jgi:hypothetical protein
MTDISIEAILAWLIVTWIIDRYLPHTPRPALPTQCYYPINGWRCTRPAGHDGPCSASPLSKE